MKELLEKYYQDLHRMAFRLTGNDFDADDLTQDTAERMIRDWDKFDGTNFLGWGRIIMRNIWINWKKRENWYSSDEIPDIPDNKTEEVVDINILPEDLRPCYLLVISGWKYKEISEKLGIPVGTVKSRVYRIKKLLNTM